MEKAYLLAVADVESGDNPLAVGKKGETTRYQFMPAMTKRWELKDASQETISAVMLEQTRINQRVLQQRTSADKDNPVMWYAIHHLGYSKVKSYRFSIVGMPPQWRAKLFRFHNVYTQHLINMLKPHTNQNN